jgi:regulator of RNase E activity RraA
MAVPKNNRIVVVDTHFPEEHTYCGKVEDLLATQFTYRGKDGVLRYAFYRDGWRYKTEVDKDGK